MSAQLASRAFLARLIPIQNPNNRQRKDDERVDIDFVPHRCRSHDKFQRFLQRRILRDRLHRRCYTSREYLPSLRADHRVSHTRAAAL